MPISYFFFKWQKKGPPPNGTAIKKNNLSLVAAEEEMLLGDPLAHDEVEGGVAGGARHAGQEAQDGVRLG